MARRLRKEQIGHIYPQPAQLDEYSPALARMVAATSWLPNPETVAALGQAVFPAARARKKHPRKTLIMEGRQVVGMYDDNKTPAWAVEWTHGMAGQTRPQGWVFAHVWSDCDDLNSYTHLANLVMVPESLSTLTDKSGPLTGYLRWHAWKTYSWKPPHADVPEAPPEYESVRWRYLPKMDLPDEIVDQQFERLSDKRLEILRPLMGMWRRKRTHPTATGP